MLGKDELIKSLQEINDKRLLSSEVTTLLAPFKEVTFPLSLELISHSRSFGKQDDSIYNGGQTGIFKIADLGIECAVLFAPEDNDMIEEQKPGSRSEFIVRYIDYDSLYQRIIIAKVKTVTGKDEGVTNGAVPSSVDQGPNERKIEAPQRSDSAPKEVQKRPRGSSLKSKKKKRKLSFSKKNKRELSFSRSTASNGAGQRRDWLAERSAQEDIKKNLFIRIAPILIGGGIIFCLDGCSELLPDGKGAVSFLMGIILLVVGISLRIHDKRK